MKAPFPYFGGKSKIAPIVWDALGDCAHYLEPFFGSGSVLLSRPEVHIGRSETICDKDGHIANVWRALQFAPDEVARWCDWPVNHADLCARKACIIKNESHILTNLIKDDAWYDPKLAGYWIWAASCWIGTGLTSPNGIPQLATGSGVHKIGKIPHIGNSGSGVHKIGKRPHIGNSGSGIQEPYKTTLFTWFRQLSERLRYVRVVCGDWTRICGGQWQDSRGICGMFFDPPYGVTDRATDIYRHDSTDVAKDVLAWCIERGNNKSYRIVLTGYDEYEVLAQHFWRKQTWEANGGYSNTARNKAESRGQQNRKRETIWFSPHCLSENNSQQSFCFDKQ